MTPNIVSGNGQCPRVFVLAGGRFQDGTDVSRGQFGVGFQHQRHHTRYCGTTHARAREPRKIVFRPIELNRGGDAVADIAEGTQGRLDTDARSGNIGFEPLVQGWAVGGKVGQCAAYFRSHRVQVFRGVSPYGDDAVATSGLLDAVVRITTKPTRLSGLEGLPPVAHIIGQVRVIPGMHTTAFTGYSH